MPGKKKGRFRFIQQKFPKKMQKKLAMMFVLIILAFIILIGIITYINATKGKNYTQVVLEQQQYDSRVIPFKRGDILDRNETKLATSERVYNVILDCHVLLTGKDEKVTKAVAQTKEVLKECFGIEEESVQDVLDKNPGGRYNILLKEVSYAEAKKFEEKDEDNKKYPYLSGVWLEEDYVRAYPYNSLASDVIGFTVAGNVGNAGLESSYNSELNGTDGREYGYLDNDSSMERIVKEPVNGNTIVTSLDLNLQSIVEKYILEFNEKHKNEAKKGFGSKNTAVMVMNPNTGEILAMASYPNYDLNNPRDLTPFFTEKEIEKMSDEEKVEQLNLIWKNFCVTDTYEPGSTIKPFTVAAGLEIGKLNGNETYTCGGSLKVSNYNIRCSNRKGHGTQSLKMAVANSCNVALMKIAQKMGKEEFCKYQRVFGFGEYTGIDLPGEALTEGLLYYPDNMGIVDLSTNSFGQNFNVTMVQLAAGFCSLINGGNYYEPHVVKQIQDSGGNVIETKDPVLLKKTISEETSEKVREYMRAVVTDGSGKKANLEGYDIGGKTGTAEKLPRGNGKHLVSFASYAPQKNPEIMVYVVIDEPNVGYQENSAYAVELSAKIMKEAFPYLGITKTK